jgi:hypothetical protein
VIDTTDYGWHTTLPVASTTPVMLEPGQLRSLSTGSFGDVYVKASSTLDLSGAGRFRFRSLMVEPGGIIRVKDNLPTELYIDATATFRGAITTPTASTPPPLTMVIFGTGQMSFESSIRALMIAPSGKVVLGGMARDFFGAVFGKAVELRPDVILHHLSFGLPPFNPAVPDPTTPPPDLPDLPAPFVSASAHCGPREELAFSSWPIQGFCPTQLALSPFNGTRTGQLHWLAALPSATVGQPIVGESGRVLAATESGLLISLNDTGHIEWSATLANIPTAAPTVLRSGDIVVPLKNGKVQVLTRSGDPRWTSATVCAGLPSAVTVDEDGNLLAACSTGAVALLSASTGTVLWTTTLASGVHSILTVGNPSVVLAATETQLVRLVRQNGSITWTRALPGAAVGPAALVRDVAFVATANGALSAIGTDGTLRWQTSLGGTPSGTLAVSPWGLVLVPMQSGELVAIDVATGAVRLHVPVTSEPLTQVIVGGDGIAYVASANGVFGVVPSTGALLWSYDPAGSTRGIALADQGFVLAGTTSGQVVAIGSNPNWTMGGNPGTSGGAGGSGAGGTSGTGGTSATGGSSTGGSSTGGSSTGGSSTGGSSTGGSSTGGSSTGGSSTGGSSTGGSSTGGSSTGANSGGSFGFNPAECEAQMLATGSDICNPGGDHWGDHDRVATGTGGAAGSGGSAGSTSIGQSACLPPSPPPTVTSQGLSGLGYVATQTDGIDTGELVLNPPASVPAGCDLRFCEEDADGVEHQIALSFSRVAQNPAGLSGTKACVAAGAGAECPMDPASRSNRACEDDSQCNAGETCGVFCDDAGCQTYATVCGQRMQCANSGLTDEPTGPFNQADPSTWPCEELLECMETDAEFGATGDPDLAKSGSLEQRGTPPAAFSATPSLLVPLSYDNYGNTLAADPCNSSPIGNANNSQLDSRSGSNGNKKWGLFVEPDLSQKYDVGLSEAIALPNIDIEARGSFRAGARVWGKEIEIINGKAEAVLQTCSAHLMPSLTVLGIELSSWAAYASDDAPPAPEPPSEQDSLDCQSAVNALNDQIANLKKSLLDARAAWDAYRRSPSVVSQQLCDRTRAVLGNVDPGGCTVASARAWIQHYKDQVASLEGYVDGEYNAALTRIASQAEGAISFAPATGGPFADIGASASYPLGPLVLTLEIDVAGDIDASGRLAYSAGLDRLASGTGGPNVHVEAAPGAHVDAFVFVGVGLPGVSVGIEGQLRLIGVSAPLTAGIELTRTGYSDSRPFDSSGLFGFVSSGPSLLRAGTQQKWNASWDYGAGVRLDTLSGKISLAARIRLLFFKKTFRKKIAEWAGLTKTYNFVGKLEQPLEGAVQSDVMMSDIPFPDGLGDLEAAFNATPIGIDLPVTNLGDTTTPGACSCVDLNNPCTASSDCCNGYECRANTSGALVCQQPFAEVKPFPGISDIPHPDIKGEL